MITAEEALTLTKRTELMSDRFGGCEFGERKDENIRAITTELGHISGKSQ